MKFQLRKIKLLPFRWNMGNDTSKVKEIVDLIKNDDFCSFASQIAENEAIIKDSDDYGRTLLWVSFN